MTRSKGAYRKTSNRSKLTYKRRAAQRQGWVQLDDTWQGQCANCSRQLTLAAVTLEHIMPRAIGGSNEAENLELLCADCNGLKSVEDQRITEFFRAQMGAPSPIHLRSIDTEHKTVQCKMTQASVALESSVGCLGNNRIPCPFLVALRSGGVLCSWGTDQWQGQQYQQMSQYFEAGE